jgi:hypothetical protein
MPKTRVGKFVRKVRNRFGAAAQVGGGSGHGSAHANIGAWFAKLDRAREGQFLGKGLMQPATPCRKIFE